MTQYYLINSEEDEQLNKTKTTKVFTEYYVLENAIKMFGKSDGKYIRKILNPNNVSYSVPIGASDEPQILISDDNDVSPVSLFTWGICKDMISKNGDMKFCANVNIYDKIVETSDFDMFNDYCSHDKQLSSELFVAAYKLNKKSLVKLIRKKCELNYNKLLLECLKYDNPECLAITTKGMEINDYFLDEMCCMIFKYNTHNSLKFLMTSLDLNLSNIASWLIKDCVEDNNVEILRYIAESDGKENLNSSVLLHAVSSDNLDIVKMLVEEYKVSVDDYDRDFLSPACENSNVEMLKYLLSIGVYVNGFNNKALYEAIESKKNSLMMVTTLDKFGCDLHCHYNRPLKLAKHLENIEVETYIRSRGKK